MVMAALVTGLGGGGIRDKGKDAKITCRVLSVSCTQNIQV